MYSHWNSQWQTPGLMLKLHLLFSLFYSRDQVISHFILLFWLLLKLLSFQVWQSVNNAAPPKQTWSQRSKTHCLYNQDIKSTKCQITGIIAKEWNTFKLILILGVMIGTFHSRPTQLILSFRHIYDLLLCAIWVRHAYNAMFNFGPCVENVSIFKNRTIVYV